jgi:hypothetical protein
MYTLLETCLDKLDIFEFLTHVENGLKDHYDIKVRLILVYNNDKNISIFVYQMSPYNRTLAIKKYFLSFERALKIIHKDFLHLFYTVSRVIGEIF